MGDRHGPGRGRGRWQNNEANAQLFEDAYAADKKRVDDLYKSRFGVDTRELDVEQFAQHVDDLFQSNNWHVDKLLEVKKDLNETKDKLDSMRIEDWNALARRTNLPQGVVHLLREREIEMATIAWAKMYEALARYPIFPRPRVQRGTRQVVWPDADDPERPCKAMRAMSVPAHDPSRRAAATVHLCEAPGAFIAALNHFVRTELLDLVDWDWRALTLNPYHEGNDTAAMVEDDALIAQTKIHWHFGADQTGDIRKRKNIEAFWAECQEMFTDLAVPGALLVTGDGSIDCQEHPNEQEATTASLHYAEIVAALGVLAEGGSMFLKAFTILEDSSFGLLYLCGVFFENVDVYKPVTSKHNNSETYMCCRHFRGISETLRTKLLAHVGVDIFADNTLLPRAAMPQRFFSQVCECGIFFAKRTRDALEDALRKRDYPRGHPADRALHRIKDECAAEWLARFRLENNRMAPESRLSPDFFLSGRDNRTGTGNRIEKLGTLAERRRQYQEYREAQGLAQPRLIKRMREEEGLESNAQEKEPGGKKLKLADKFHEMMAKMGHKEGEGLGAQGQGIAEPLADSGPRGRMGLGFGNEGRYTSVKPTLALQPDATVLTNDKALMEDENPAFGPASDEVTYVWDSVTVDELPDDILRTKFATMEVFLEVKKARKAAHAALLQDAQASEEASLSGLCPHAGVCIAARTAGPYKRPFWKLSALDMHLSEPTPCFSAAPMLDSRLLRAAFDPLLAHIGAACAHFTDALCLSVYDNTSAEYLALMDADGQHSLRLRHCFCLPVADAPGPACRAWQGTVRTVDVGVAMAAPDADQDAKLLMYSASTSDAVKNEVGSVDVVIGDLCGLAKDVPHAQQLSVWPEYNRVWRRKLVWEAVTALRCCKPGGAALLRIGDVFTTFTAGLLYILFRNFREFAVVKPFSSCAASAERFVLLTGCTEQVQNDEEDMDSVLYLLDKLQLMEETEGVVEPEAVAEGGTVRPHPKLLCRAHVSDLLPANMYCAVKPYLDFLTDRVQKLARRQSAVLLELAGDASLRASPSAKDAEEVLEQTCRVLTNRDGMAAPPAREVLEAETGVQIIGARRADEGSNGGKRMSDDAGGAKLDAKGDVEMRSADRSSDQSGSDHVEVSGRQDPDDAAGGRAPNAPEPKRAPLFVRASAGPSGADALPTANDGGAHAGRRNGGAEPSGSNGKQPSSGDLGSAQLSGDAVINVPGIRKKRDIAIEKAAAREEDPGGIEAFWKSMQMAEQLCKPCGEARVQASDPFREHAQNLVKRTAEQLQQMDL